MRTDVVIVGAGMTGLSVARSLEVEGLLLEKEPSVGGCLRTDQVDGYSIDRTGHLLHMQDPYVRKVMFEELSLDWLQFERRAEIRLLDRTIPYPIQYNLHALPRPERDRCVADYLAVAGDVPPFESSFDQWSRTAYGDGLHELFFSPYNRKLWQADLASMSAEWVKRFVPLPDRQLVLDGARQPHASRTFGYNATFHYPLAGGTGAIVEEMAANLKLGVETEAALVSIDPVAKTCEFTNGMRIGYQKLVSTIPLPRLLRLIHKVDQRVLELSEGLRHNSVFYFAFGFRTGQDIPDTHWIYVPEERFRIYRAGILSGYSPNVAPRGCTLVCAEIGCSADDASRMDPAMLRPQVLEDLVGIGLVRPEWPLELEHHGAIDCAYVIFDEHRRKALPEIQRYLQRLGIHSIGRYGAWDYGSMGDALIEGRDCARLINSELGQHRSSAH